MEEKDMTLPLAMDVGIWCGSKTGSDVEYYMSSLLDTRITRVKSITTRIAGRNSSGSSRCKIILEFIFALLV
jgi:hypothetical protein